MGRHEEAIASSRRAEQLDPLSVQARSFLAGHFNRARRYTEAIEQSNKASELDPGHGLPFNSLATAYEAMGLYEEAAAAEQKRLMYFHEASEEEVAGLTEAASAGAEEYWKWKLDYYEERAKQTYVAPTTMAELHGRVGEKDQAFEWLERAYDQRHGQLIYLGVVPGWDPLRDDPRFHDLPRRMNLEP